MNCETDTRNNQSLTNLETTLAQALRISDSLPNSILRLVELLTASLHFWCVKVCLILKWLRSHVYWHYCVLVPLGSNWVQDDSHHITCLHSISVDWGDPEACQTRNIVLHGNGNQSPCMQFHPILLEIRHAVDNDSRRHLLFLVDIFWCSFTMALLVKGS